MNRSQKSPSSEVERSGNQAFGTQVPVGQSVLVGAAVLQGHASESDSSIPAYQTYTPPTGPGGTEKSLRAVHATFAPVFKTTGGHNGGLLDVVNRFQSPHDDDDDGDSIQTLEVPHKQFENSDFIKTINLPSDSFPGPKQVSEESYQRTIELPAGRSDMFGSSPSGGKSTWQLQIREKSLKGYVSGVRNRIPQANEDAVGFLAAFLDNPEVAEYEVLKELGKGNMGIVYEARQSSLNRELAIKSLNPKEGAARYEQEMFVSEAVVTANLVHPNIVPIHDLGRTDDGKLFYSMKKVMGVSWDKTIREKSIEENLDIFMKMCDAVAYAHSRGVVNRDLKPENVVVGSYGEVIVLDWGLAITNDLFPKQESILLDYRGGAGTPVYMAPELVSDDISSIGTHSDIYLLGAILFELLEGFPPHLLREFWDLENPHEQFASIVTAVMTNQIERQVTHPGELMDIAFKAMATNPKHRFQSVEEMQEMIRQYRITGHAEEFYRAAEAGGKKQSYDNYQASVALFSEALRKWPGNERAMIGDSLARKGFAELALEKGDFDLGLHLIENCDGSEFDGVRKRLKRDQRRRAGVKRTLSVLAFGIVLMAGVTLVVSKNALALAEEAKSAKETIESAEAELKAIDEQKIALAAELEAANTAKLDAEVKLSEAATKLTEVAAANVEAEMATMKAKMLQADAEKSLKKAESDIVEAVNAKTAADEAAKRAKAAAEEANLAKIDAEQKKIAAEAVLESARKAQKEAEASVLDIEWKRFNLQFNLFVSLGQIEEAYNEVQLALEKSKIKEGEEGFNPKFRDRRRTILQKEEEIKRQRTSQVRPLQGDLRSAVIGTTGQVIGFATPTKIEILYSPTGEIAGLEELKSIAYEDLKISVQLEVSPDEQFIVATGRNYKRLWSLKTGSPVDFALTDQFQADAAEKVSDYKVARFSPDSKSLFLISNDDRITLEIYDLSAGFPKPLTRTAIAGKSNNLATITDFCLVPDSASNVGDGVLHLIYLTARSGASTCHSVEVKIENGLAVLGSSQDFPDSRPDEYRREVMQGLVVSPDYQKLGIRVGGRILQILKRSDSHVPFEPIPDHSIIEFNDNLSSLAFSADGESLLAGSLAGYIEIWTWNSTQSGFEPYQPQGTQELWNQHRIGGFSASPASTVFVGESRDQILAIGRTNQERTGASHAVVRWNLNEYKQLYKDPIIELGRELFAEPLYETTSRVPQGNSLPVHSAHEQDSVESVEVVRDELLQDELLQTVAFFQDEDPQDEERISRWNVSRSAEAAQFSQDGMRIVVAADDRAAHVFARNRATVMITGGRRSRFYEPLRNIFEEGHIPELSEIMFLPPDGRRLLTKDFFGAVSVWDASVDEDGYAREVSRMLTSDFGLAVSPDGKWVLSSARDLVQHINDEGKPEEKSLFVAKLWDTTTFETDPTPDAVRTFAGKHDRLITAVAVSPNSTAIVTADRRGHIVVWDLMTAEVIAEISGQHGNDQVSGIAFLNENELVSTGFDGRVQRWLLKQNQIVAADGRFEFKRESDLDDYIISLMISPDRRHFATVSVKTGGILKQEGEGADQVPQQAPNRVRLTIWSVENPQQPRDLKAIDWPKGKSEFDQGVSWSLNGNTLAHIYPIADLGGTLRSEIALYDTVSWEITRKYQPVGLTGSASKVAFSPVMHIENKEQIATFDGRVAHLWKLGDGEHLAEFRSHETVYSADFSADRKLVATASDSIRVFVGDELSPNHGSTVLRMTNAHLGRIEEVKFSKQPGKYDFVTMGGDTKIKIWNWNWAANDEFTPPGKPVVTISLEPTPPNPEVMWDSTLSWTSSLDWSTSENLLTSTFAGELYVYRRAGEMFERVSMPLPEGVHAKFNSCTISVDEKMIAAGGAQLLDDGRSLESFTAIWKLQEDGSPLLVAVCKGSHSPNLNPNRVAGTTAVKFRPLERKILTGGTDGTLWEWDWDDRETESDPVADADPFESHKVDNANPHGTSTVNSIDVSKDGAVITAGSDGNVAFWPAVKEDL